MNRQAQRQLQRQNQKNETLYHLTAEQLKYTIDEKIKGIEKKFAEDIINAKKEALKYATRSVSAIILLSLRDEMGLGEKRLQRVIDRAMKNFDCVESGLVSPQDFVDELQKYGVTI